MDSCEQYLAARAETTMTHLIALFYAHNAFAMSAFSSCVTKKKVVDLKYISVLLNILNKK